MKSKKWNVFVLGTTVVILCVLGGVTMFIDPFLHYHKGLPFLEYPLKEERYQNDGISRHYEFDSIITGTSMCQNFKSSQFDELWGAMSVKLNNSGASFHETNENLRRALSRNNGVKYVVSSLDTNLLNYPAVQDAYEGYPDYLYDNNIFNDVNYLLNKEVLRKSLAVINYTRAGNKTTSRDEYGSWGDYRTYGADAVLGTFTLAEELDEETVLTEEDIQRIKENITENYLKTAHMYPDTTFYLFIPPYSICYWEALVRTKQLGATIEAQKTGVELLLSEKNVLVFDYSYRTDITGNLDNYTDTLHYGGWINDEIMQMMKNGEGQLTQDNYQEYYESLEKMYEEYDYTAYRANVK